MGNELCKSDCLGRNRRQEQTQQETPLDNLPPARPRPPEGITGGTQESSRLRIPAHAPERQTQTVGQQESNPREVAPTDFNNYIRVDQIQIINQKTIDKPYEAGHSFTVEFTVKNTTSDYLRFTNTPTVVWREIENKEDNTGGTNNSKSLDHDLYAEKPTALTFFGWRTLWNETIKPNETKKIIIEDVPRLTGLDQEKDGQRRTVSRRLDFEVSVPGNGPTWRATQNIEVVNGEVQEQTFQEN